MCTCSLHLWLLLDALRDWSRRLSHLGCSTLVKHPGLSAPWSVPKQQENQCLSVMELLHSVEGLVMESAEQAPWVTAGLPRILLLSFRLRALARGLV